MTSDTGPIRDWHQLAVELLLTDTDLALASVAYLFVTDDREAVAHLVRDARQAYDSASERRKTLKLSVSDAAQLDDKMDRLRARLKFLGETV
ncbi:MAG: hypothetical protein WBD46_07040 [Acidobacteriaceae bacterium]